VTRDPEPPRPRLAVSVVVPFYEAERYLDETLSSIEDQTWPPDELVLVDDGSTDGGPAIAAAHRATSSTGSTGSTIGRVQIVTQANRGIGAARNAGLAAATGDLVAFCDADDLWMPTKMAVQVEALSRQDRWGASLCGVEEFVSPDVDPAVAAGLRPARRLEGAAATSALVVRRAVLDQVGPFDESMAVGEWFDWYARLRESGSPIHTVPDLLVRRRLHGANNSLRQRDSRAEYLQVLRAHLGRTRSDP
jgi:glycosyltransferase involved in cell wall biosynthesis